jgi:iron complex transport system substrate-binding protein
MKTNLLVGMTAILLLFCCTLPAAASDYTLGIFGNANEDETISMQDVTYTELIILEYRDRTDLADAKYDDKINMQDVTQIELVILGKEKELTFIDSADRIITLDMPVETMVIGHPGDAEAVRLLGAWDRVSGRDHYTTDEILFPGACNLPECSGENLYDIHCGVISGLNPDLYLTQFLPEPGFEDMVQEINQRGIPVVALNFENPATLVRNIRLLTYILNTEEDGEEFITLYNNIEKKITEKTDRLSWDEEPQVFIWYFDNDYETCYRTIGKGAPGIQAQFDIAGARNVFANEAGVFPKIDPGKLARRDIDAIVCLVSPAVVKDIFGYEIDHPKLANKVKDWVMDPYRNSALAETAAVKNGEVYLIQNEMLWSPRHVVALTTNAKWFHPGLFMDLDRQKVHQQYLDTLNIDYDFDERGIFYW